MTRPEIGHEQNLAARQDEELARRRARREEDEVTPTPASEWTHPSDLAGSNGPDIFEETEADPYIALVRAIGDGFHPDTSGAEYVSLPDGYTPERVDEIVDAEFAANFRDPYAVANSVLDVARVEFTADRIRRAFGEGQEMFASDPGGCLDYVGTFDDVDEETARAAIVLVLDGWGFKATSGTPTAPAGWVKVGNHG